MAYVVTEEAADDAPLNHAGGLRTVEVIEDLWEDVCDSPSGLLVASRHAFDDAELRDDDLAHIEVVRSLRKTYLACAALPELGLHETYLLADIDRRLMSLEGRVEMVLLAIT